MGLSEDSTSSSADCPGELTDEYESPNLLITVDSSHPNKAYGEAASGEVSSTLSSIFRFHVPSSGGSDAGKTCKLVFFYANTTKEEDVQKASGAVEFSRLEGSVDLDTTQNSLPAVAQSYHRLTVAPGNAYTIESFACPSEDEDVVVELSSAPGSQTALRFAQDSSDACPLGLYLLATAPEGVEL
ncbi:ubiquitin 3 binding protein But2 C-terminal domain-containing protein [Daldinia bambusicola]|nr:ubiquitin 3 binding protein But2 C-terminal domain-containing protein [Daldinia bambusicola]